MTVALVTLNAAATLDETLQSVLAQTFESLEVVVVDGGSTDGTLDIIAGHEDRIASFVSEPDNGIYDGMNKAGDLARGEYVNFMNAGDSFVSPDTVARVFAAFEGSPDLVYGDAYAVDGDECKLMRSGGPVAEVILDRIPFCHQALFARTDTFRRYRFKEEFHVAADYDFVLRCFRGGAAFHRVDVPVANYRIGGFTKQNADRCAHEIIKSMYDNGLDPERIVRSAVLRALVRRAEPDRMRDRKISEQAETLASYRRQIAQLKAEVARLSGGGAAGGAGLLDGLKRRFSGRSGGADS